MCASPISPRTGLLGTTSLAFHHLHLELPAGADPREAKRALRKEFPDATWRLETPEDRRETLGDALDNFQQFLGIIALVALVLGAIGVAGAVHAHVSRRVPTVAILRCLGCPGNLAFGIYFAQAIALGVLGAVLGAASASRCIPACSRSFAKACPSPSIPRRSGGSSAQTTAAGFAVCCGFALCRCSACAASRPPPRCATARRSGGTRSALRAWPVYLLLAGLLVLVAVLNAADWKRALGMVGGLGVAFGMLVAVARGLDLRRAPRRPPGLAVSAAAGHFESAPSAQSDAALPALARPRHLPAPDHSARAAISSRNASRFRNLPRARTSTSSMCSPTRSKA